MAEPENLTRPLSVPVWAQVKPGGKRPALRNLFSQASMAAESVSLLKASGRSVGATTRPANWKLGLSAVFALQFSPLGMYPGLPIRLSTSGLGSRRPIQQVHCWAATTQTCIWSVGILSLA